MRVRGMTRNAKSSEHPHAYTDNVHIIILEFTLLWQLVVLGSSCCALCRSLLATNERLIVIIHLGRRKYHMAAVNR